MQLSQQEILFLDRMAHHMISTGDMDIERAGQAALKQDRELAMQMINARPVQRLDGYELEGGAAVREQMAKRVYVRLRRDSLHMGIHV